VPALPDFTLGQPKHEERRVREYVEWHARGETVAHLEKVGSESLMGRTVGFWSVRTNRRKWWVITSPTNFYARRLFPSLDYTVMPAHDGGYEGNARVHRVERGLTLCVPRFVTGQYSRGPSRLPGGIRAGWERAPGGGPGW
jgi:hypothetical protein